MVKQQIIRIEPANIVRIRLACSNCGAVVGLDTASDRRVPRRNQED